MSLEPFTDYDWDLLHTIDDLPPSDPPDPATPIAHNSSPLTTPPTTSPHTSAPLNIELLQSELSLVYASSPTRDRSHAARKGWARRRANLAQDFKTPEPSTHQRQPPDENIRRTIFIDVLESLQAKGLNFGELVLFVSDPSNWQGDERWDGFFSVPGRVRQVLNFWVSSRNSETGRRAVQEWAVDYVKQIVNKEGNAVTRSKLLQTRHVKVDRAFALGFSLEKIGQSLDLLCPVMMDFFRTFSTTARQQRNMSTSAKIKKNNFVTSQALIALAARSQTNSYARQVLGLYAYASGAQRQVLSVLSHLGVTSSYAALTGSSRQLWFPIGSNGTSISGDVEEQAVTSELTQAGHEKIAAEVNIPEENEDEEDELDEEDEEDENDTVPASGANSGRDVDVKASKPFFKRALGLLKLLSTACIGDVRLEAQTGLLGNVYDNINIIFKVTEQILGRKDSQQNGTCAMAFKLFNASLDDMRTADTINAFFNAPPLSFEDVLLTTVKNATLTKRLQHVVMRVIVSFGGEQFSRFVEEVTETTPQTEDLIDLHQTELFPLPAMHIDESSTTGNTDVLKEIYTVLGLDMNSPSFTEHVKIIAGDQLSVARIRSLIANRAGHETFGNTFLWALCMPGLFHYKMVATHGLLELHYGTASSCNPASLAFHNTRLDRKPIVLTSLPPFRTSRDLIFVSLYARVLHCLLLVSGCANLDEYAAKTSFEKLKANAKTIVAQFANPQVAQKARQEREDERRAWEASRSDIDHDEDLPEAPTFVPTTGDVVFENAILFLRDALVLREFNDAIKAGDSGRVVTVLKIWTLAFRGSGRTKYAYEMLHLIHNLTHVWPAPLRRIVLQNWLVNPTGKANSWVEVDLMQEHLNFWTKTIYQAHGSNASWEWLAMISPCIDILRRLATRINHDLGSRQGTKHTSPDLEKDIEELMLSLAEHHVYTREPGRVIDGEASDVVSNAVSAGWNQMAAPLQEFNIQLARLQKRCTITPIVGPPYSAFRASNLNGTAAPSAIPASPQAAATSVSQAHKPASLPREFSKSEFTRYPPLKARPVCPVGLGTYPDFTLR